MKNRVLFLLLAALLFCCVACSASDPVNTETATAQKSLYEQGLSVVELLVEITRTEGYVDLEQVMSVLTIHGHPED